MIGRRRVPAPPERIRPFRFSMHARLAANGRTSVGPAELPVIPGGDAPGANRMATRFRAWAWSAAAAASVDLGVPRRSARQLLGQLEHRVGVAVDLRLRLDLDAAQLAVLVSGLDSSVARGSRSRFLTFCDFA